MDQNMEICRKKNRFLFLVILIISLQVFGKVKADINSKNISVTDFINLKYDIYFTNNKINILKTGGVTVKYSFIRHKVTMDEDKNFNIILLAFMDRKRYLQIKKNYRPKIEDCNIIRNKILLNKRGYTMFRLKKNNKVTEELMREEILKSVMNINSISEEEKIKLVNNTKISIEVIHPKSQFNISCSGNLIEFGLD